jgi:nitrate reductase gamma subunit
MSLCQLGCSSSIAFDTERRPVRFAITNRSFSRLNEIIASDYLAMSIMRSALQRNAYVAATIVTLLLVIAIVVGSRRLQNFDPALIGYLFGTIFACLGIVYRFACWLQRPPTWRFFCRTRQMLLSPQGWRLIGMIIREALDKLVAQRFIRHRGKKRWAGHMLMAWGCMLGFAVTIPLTFGWIQFDLKAGTTDTYIARTFGFPVFVFPLHSFPALMIFHVLVWASLAVIAGVGILMYRRMTDPGLIATQNFRDDWLPLLLLMAIAVTGLGLTLDYEYLKGSVHQFMAITHALTVILFLVWLPFGKFFHIVQRPMQIGVDLYRRVGSEGEAAVCPHTSEVFATKVHIDDLKIVTRELGFDFTLADGTSHLDLSPQGKRAALFRAHMKAREESGAGYFG